MTETPTPKTTATRGRKRNQVSPEKKREIGRAIKAYRNDRGISQDEFARESSKGDVTLSKGYISLMESDDAMKYEPVSDEAWIHAASIVGVAIDENTDWKVYSGHNIKMVTGLCDRVGKERIMAAIAADTGFSKTTSLKYYARKNQDTYYCLLRATMNQKSIVRAIANSLNITVDGTLSDMNEAVAHTLRRKCKVLILDDVGKVIEKAYPIIQELFDMTEGRVGIILAGTKALKLKCDSGRGRKSSAWPEFNRRISYWLKLQAPTVDEVRHVCLNNGLNDEVAIKYIARKSENFGDVRNYILAIRRFGDDVEWNIDLLSELPIGTSDYES